MSTPATTSIGPTDVHAAAGRISATIRPVTVSDPDPGTFGTARVLLAHEYMQHTGSFKARGAANLAAFHLDAASMPEAGITIASGGNAGLACAWAAKATCTKMTPSAVIAGCRLPSPTARQEFLWPGCRVSGRVLRRYLWR
jgi:threonine dehydratase